VIRHRAFAALAAAILLSGCAATRKAPIEAGSIMSPWPSHLPGHPSEIAIPPLEFTPPEPEIRTLANGVTVYYFRDSTLPLIDFTLYFPYGTMDEPSRVTGIGSILGTVWREGGTATNSGEQISEELEFLSASLEVSVSERTTSLSASGHSKDTDRLLALLADLTLNPLLPEDRLEQSRARALELVRRRLDRPDALASSGLNRAMYGDWHPLGRESTAETIGAITRDDLAAMHRRIVGPSGARLAVVGDFEPEAMQARLESLFGTMRNDGQKQWKEPTETATVTPGWYLIDRDAAQTQIRFGQLGLPRRHPDWFAVQVMNEIFGTGGFNSRLMQEIRSRRGLTYGVGASLSEGDYGGRFILASSTKNESARELVDVAIAEMRRIMAEPVSQAELDAAKKSMTNAWVFSYDDPGQIVTSRLLEDMFRNPPERRTEYLAGIAAVTAEDVQRVARTYLKPDQLVVMLVGPEAALRPQFEDKGLRLFAPWPTEPAP
jgi:predicted Zn-dependent peptidase